MGSSGVGKIREVVCLLLVGNIQEKTQMYNPLLVPGKVAESVDTKRGSG